MEFDREAFAEALKAKQIREYGRILTDKEIDEIENKSQQEENKYKLEEIVERFKSVVPPRFENARFDNYICETEKQRKAVKWLETGKSAVIYGANGIGKTHLAYASCFHQAQQGKRPFYTLAFDLFTEIKQSFSKGNTLDIVKKYAGYEYLVVDEVDKTYASETDFVYFFSIVNERYNFLRPTVLIANSANMSEVSGKSSFDRIASEGRVIYLDGDNFRQKKRG